MQKDLNRRIDHATKWSTITEFSTKLITPLTNAILARLLKPSEFGIVATLTLVVTFTEIFTDAGFQKYIVQHDFDDENDLDLSTSVAFWCNLCLSLLLWAIIALFSKTIAQLVGSPGHEGAIIVICGQIPLAAFSSIQMSRFRRDFAFKDLFVVRLLVAVVPLFITIPCAFIFRSYWALVIGILVKELLNAILLTAKSQWKPSFSFRINKVKEMLSFSIWTVIENVTIWLGANAGILIISNLLGEYYLGLYKTANATVSGYMGVFTASTMPVLFASLSRCQNDDIEFKSIFYRFQRLVAIIVFPLGLGCFVYRGLLTRILLGQQWLEISNYLGMLFFTRAMEIVFSYYNSEVFRSKGRPKLSVLAQFIYTIVAIPMLLWGARRDFDIFVLVSCLTSYVLIIATSTISRCVLKFKIIDSFEQVWPSMVSAILMACTGLWLRSFMGTLIWEIVSIVLCIFIYCSMMIIIPTGRKQLAEIPILQKVFHLRFMENKE